MDNKKIELIDYKHPSKNFDWNSFVLNKLLKAFPMQFLTGTLISKKDVFQRLGLFLTMKKKYIRVVLKEIETNSNGLIHVNQRGLHINPEKLSQEQRAEIMQFLNRGRNA